MLLKDTLSDHAFQFGFNGNSKEEIIKEIAELFNKAYNLDTNVVFNALMEREKKGSTGLGKGLAVPHARINDIGEMKIVVVYDSNGKNFEAYDKEPTKLFFSAMIDIEGHPQDQLEMLKVIVETCEKTDLMNALNNTHTSTQVKDLILRRITEIQNG